MIAHFVYNYLTYSGAAGQVNKLANSLSKLGLFESVIFNVQTIEGDDSKVIIKNGRQIIINLPRNIFLRVVISFYFLHKFKVKLVHLHGFHKPAIIIAKLLNIPILLKSTLLGQDDVNSLLKKNKLNKTLLSFVCKINCLNNVIYDINKCEIDESKLEIIPNGVVIREPLATHEFQREQDSYIFVGAIVKRKSPLEVIKYFKTNYLCSQNAKLYFLGPNDSSLPEFDSRYYKQCLDECGLLLNKNIFFLGNISRHELEQYYLNSTAMIFFSKKEGTPNVVLEAMSLNCPIVHKSDDIIVKSLLGMELGNLLDSQTASSYSSNKFSEISNSGCLRNRATLFSIDEIARKHCELYENIIRNY
ncbi:MAG TPA: hypothetical protein DG048_07335 [Pseudoalteromonas sp.]|nr:hypothetical protein [Pseudoalteromonas sp.]